MDFKYKLYYILSSISKHKKNKADAFYDAVQARLDKSLSSYEKSLEDATNYLTSRDALNVMKKLNKD